MDRAPKQCLGQHQPSQTWRQSKLEWSSDSWGVGSGWADEAVAGMREGQPQTPCPAHFPNISGETDLSKGEYQVESASFVGPMKGYFLAGALGR